MSEPNPEFRYFSNLPERLDEICATNVESLHFEVMSDQAIWCGFKVNGKDYRVWICSKNGRSHITYSVETD